MCLGPSGRSCCSSRASSHTLIVLTSAPRTSSSHRVRVPPPTTYHLALSSCYLLYLRMPRPLWHMSSVLLPSFRLRHSRLLDCDRDSRPATRPLIFGRVPRLPTPTFVSMFPIDLTFRCYSIHHTFALRTRPGPARHHTHSTIHSHRTQHAHGPSRLQIAHSKSVQVYRVWPEPVDEDCQAKVAQPLLRHFEVISRTSTVVTRAHSRCNRRTNRLSRRSTM